MGNIKGLMWKKTVKAVIYIRVSSESQDDISLENQEARAKAYILRVGNMPEHILM